MIIDSHCHLNFPDLGCLGDKTQEFIKLAREHDVLAMLNIATRLKFFKDVVEFGIKNKEVYSALGVHPCNIDDDIDITLIRDTLKKYIGVPENKVIGVGESGLDYCNSSIDKKTIDLQRELFLTHMEVASECEVPIIVHTREAREDTIDLIKSFARGNNIGGVMHCFTGDIDFAREMLDIGFYISFSGILTFKNAGVVQETAKFVPLNRTLVETDSPYLAPMPYRGAKNQPANVYYVAKFLAYLRGKSLEEIGEITTNNFRELFKVDI